MSTIRIKQLRIEKGLTLGQLAEKVGLSESHLSRVEAGVGGVKLSKLGALAKVLGVPMIELMPQENFEHASDLTPYVPPEGFGGRESARHIEPAHVSRAVGCFE